MWNVQTATLLIGILTVGLLIGLGVLLILGSLKNICSKRVDYDEEDYKDKKFKTGKLDPMYNQSNINFPVDAQNSEPNPRFDIDGK